jgi:hypothetical protein
MHRCEDDLEMNLREIGWEDVEWMNLTQDRDQWWALVNVVVNLLGSIKGEEFLDYLSEY